MSLSPDDVQAIGALLDEKLERIQAVERRRRRFWLWFWILVFVGSTLVSWLIAQRVMSQLKVELARMDDQMRDAKLAYQAELKRNVAMQAERRLAEQGSKYQSKQQQSEYEAGLLRLVFQAMNKQAESRKKLEALDGDDPEELSKAVDDMSGTLTQTMMALTQIMLRNTDPALNTKEEKLLSSEAEGATAPNAPAGK